MMTRAQAGRLAARPRFGAHAAPSGAGHGGSPFVPTFVQQVVDPTFDDATKHTLAGSGIGTTAVAAGVLTIASTSNVYTELPTTVDAPLPGGVYSTTYTISGYVSGSISVSESATTNLASSTDGTTRAANGTYTESLTVPATGGYIGLKGQGAAVVNAMTIDNFTIQRTS